MRTHGITMQVNDTSQKPRLLSWWSFPISNCNTYPNQLQAECMLWIGFLFCSAIHFITQTHSIHQNQPHITIHKTSHTQSTVKLFWSISVMGSVGSIRRESCEIWFLLTRTMNFTLSTTENKNSREMRYHEITIQLNQSSQYPTLISWWSLHNWNCNNYSIKLHAKCML